MTDAILEAIRSGVRVYDLGMPMFPGMPQSPNHPIYTHTLPRRHGDMVRADGGSAANDFLATGTHVGTHIDALAHVSQDGKLYGGLDAALASTGGRFRELGIHTVAPIFRRGILLDIPELLNVEVCAPGYEISPDQLEAAVTTQGLSISPGAVTLIRTGWGQRFPQGSEAYLGHATGVPGVGEAGATWLADQGSFAVGSDTIAFERLAPGGGHSLLPGHRVLLVERGVYIIEALALEELAKAKVYEFAFVLSPLNLFGATGSPARPLAVVAGA